ncbi:MAG: rhodanese-like domain-containing protein [Patescibacteria group bacterium]|nr:rhodanese-like domain-containing protein [Patescibacteria group bacterium]
MKKKDKNILIIAIFVVIFLLIWTMSRYELSKKNAAELKEAAVQKEETNKKEDIKKESTTEKIIPTITATEMSQKIAALSDEITVVDMRTAQEFQEGHIKGSIHIDQFDASRPTRTIIFVTTTGNEDLLMTQYRNLSNTNTVFNLREGIEGWAKDGFAMISLDIPQNFENTSKIQFIEPRDLNAINTTSEQQEKSFILDTRRSGNYEKGHVPSAVNIPFNELEYRHKEIPITKKIYVYGTDDEASFRSGVLLYDLNFIGTKTIKGGLNAWKEYGYPVATD